MQWLQWGWGTASAVPHCSDRPTLQTRVHLAGHFVKQRAVQALLAPHLTVSEPLFKACHCTQSGTSTGTPVSEGTLARPARRAKFQRSPSHLQLFGGQPNTMGFGHLFQCPTEQSTIPRHHFFRSCLVEFCFCRYDGDKPLG